MRPTARQIIEVFDECREFLWGRALGRDNPYREDMATAQRWIDAGLTITVAVIVFHQQMSWMHEKQRRLDAKDRTMLPASLKLFDENIEAAIRRANQGEQSTWDIEESRWRARCKGWKKAPGLWQPEQWGPPPFEAGCRAPASVLQEIERAA